MMEILMIVGVIAILAILAASLLPRRDSGYPVFGGKFILKVLLNRDNGGRGEREKWNPLETLRSGFIALKTRLLFASPGSQISLVRLTARKGTPSPVEKQGFELDLFRDEINYFQKMKLGITAGITAVLILLAVSGVYKKADNMNDSAFYPAMDGDTPGEYVPGKAKRISTDCPPVISVETKNASIFFASLEDPTVHPFKKAGITGHTNLPPSTVGHSNSPGVPHVNTPWSHTEIPHQNVDLVHSNTDLVHANSSPQSPDGNHSNWSNLAEGSTGP